MREQLVRFLEENYGDLECFPELDLRVDACYFCNDETELKNVRVVGNDECFECNEFYQFVLDGEHLYKAYFELARDENGNELELDAIDYTHAYKIEDVADEYLD